MYSLNPTRVYALPQLLNDSASAARIERVLGMCGRASGDLLMLTPAAEQACLCLWLRPDGGAGQQTASGPGDEVHDV